MKIPKAPLLACLFLFLCAAALSQGKDEATEGTFLLQGEDRPTAGSTLSVVAKADGASELHYKWVRGDALGVFNQEAVLSVTPEYTLTDQDYEHWVRVSVSNQSGKTVFTQDTWISKLPVLYIDVAGGNDIVSKNDYLPASLRLQGNAEYEQQYLGQTEIKGRGNSSWKLYPQKPYKLKLGKKTSLFDFGKSKHWVLLSNFNDKCGLRNYVASRLAKALGIYGMKMTWVDVVLNGEVKGCYMLSQHLRVDKHCVDIFSWKDEAEGIASPLFSAILEEGGATDDDNVEQLEDAMRQNLSWVTDGLVSFKGRTYDLADYGLKEDYDLCQGYLFEAENPYQSNSFGITTPGGIFLKINTPESVSTNPAMLAAAADIWNRFEAVCLKEPSIKGKDYGQIADMESMVGIWLVNEIMGQGDPDNSRFSYIAPDGKLHFGPAWDFDHSSACWSVGGGTTTFHTLKNRKPHSYYQYWFPDPVLCQLAYDIYWEVARPFLSDLFSEGGELEAIYANIQEALLTNDNLWGEYPCLLNPSASPRTASQDYEALRTFILEHLSWLDSQFQTVETFIDATNDICPYHYIEIEKASKIIKDSHLYIVRGSRWFNMDGRRTR
ncbi:MAG: CotH kinase family protein [Bacteroidaceae bacterium]|nr:CotH kinase family protein [Bacteroidaceae bacterium]